MPKQPSRRYRPQHRDLYNHPNWQPLRRRVFIRDNYTCQWPGCGKLLTGRGQEHNAPVAHHKQDHKGDMKLFLDEGNIMSVCVSCHNRDAQKATHRGYITGHDAAGRPLDPDHPWGRKHREDTFRG